MHETDALTGIRGISWDAEETACLCIAHETGLERRRFTWHTIRSRTGVVAVIDGGVSA